MVISTRLISFRQATEILQAETGAVRCLVVEERSLPAVYVTQVGHREPYEHQLLRVDEEGRAFDLAVGGIEGLVQTGHLRIERNTLDSFITHEALSEIDAGKASVRDATKTQAAEPEARPCIDKRWTPEFLAEVKAHCRIDECKEEIDALRKLKPVSITERMFAKQELETLEARLAGLLKPTTDPASPVADPAPRVVLVTDQVEPEAPQELKPVTLQAAAEPELNLAPQAVAVVDIEIVATVTEALSQRPLQRQQAQEQAIMCLIRDEGHDPLKLPKNEPGKPGIKAKVRKALKSNPIFTGATVFEKAWERLRNGNEIADQP